MEKIYVVTAGIYSDYHIEAIFKSKEKAATYCSCHRGCNIEIYCFSDDKIYTLFNHVTVRYEINLSKKEPEFHCYFTFERLSEKEYEEIDRNKEYAVLFGKTLDIVLDRKLPEVYDEEKIRSKYAKVFCDLYPEIENMIFQSSLETAYDRRKIAKRVEEMIKDKFGIEKERC